MLFEQKSQPFKIQVFSQKSFLKFLKYLGTFFKKFLSRGQGDKVPLRIFLTDYNIYQTPQDGGS